MPDKSLGGWVCPAAGAGAARGEGGRGEGREEGVGGRGGEGESWDSLSLTLSFSFLKGAARDDGVGARAQTGLSRARTREGGAAAANGLGGWRAGLFLNSASTRSLALWFLRVVYSIFLFLRGPTPLRRRAEARWLVGSGSARGSLARRPAPGASASWPANGWGVRGGFPGR